MDLSGRDIIVIGAGDVALDSARTAKRLGSPNVKIVCRGMRASKHELDESDTEGIQIIRNRVFKEVVIKGNKIVGVMCLEAMAEAAMALLSPGDTSQPVRVGSDYYLLNNPEDIENVLRVEGIRDSIVLETSPARIEAIAMEHGIDIAGLPIVDAPYSQASAARAGSASRSARGSPAPMRAEC